MMNSGNFSWYDPRGLRQGSYLARAARLLAMVFCLLVIGMPLYDTDVILYPGHFQSYLEKYVEFIIDPFGDNQFKTRIEVVGGSWKIGYSVEEFDGKDWRYKNDIVNTGSGTEIITPEPLPEAPTDTGEASVGQLRKCNNLEEYEVLVRDVNSGKVYKLKRMVGFHRISDRVYSLKDLNARFYRFLVGSKDTWKATILVFSGIVDEPTSLWIYLPDKLFNQVSTWPDR